MIADCANLPSFVDGHLPPEEHEGFLSHLPGCEACGVRFHDLLQLDVLGRLAMDGADVPQEAAAVRMRRPHLRALRKEHDPGRCMGEVTRGPRSGLARRERPPGH
ncbi:hypothetical protein D7Y13_35270 [Corallococcus praedator]|uniref:Putative zinc-finger domain-containing protein n=1 Tax=Corallococcus praedator TaxID=2316724 RepID=A0ABX9Q997_9BACT|nr:hypothetical protein D7X75_37625 [Corallococcus sp. CA031C]RKH92838.1 hypothetical protein D7Y13_35270 [Corallococcus praedator]